MAKNRESTAAAEKLSDEALSRQLGRCQRVEAIFMLLCIVSVIACVLVLWVWQKKLLACALLAVGAAGGLIAGAAQRQRRALLDAQLGDFYRAELDRAFGPEGRSPELRIDEAWLRESRLVDRLWEKCELRCFREGVYRGMRFSAANVILRHSYEHRSGQDMVTEITEMLDGIVIRCKAAAFTMVQTLLEAAGVSLDEVGTFYLSGGFGTHLDLESAITIGMYPDIPREKFRILGNSSLAGVKKLLTDRTQLDRVRYFAGQTAYVQFGAMEKFVENMTAAQFLPHTNAALYPSVKRRR